MRLCAKVGAQPSMAVYMNTRLRAPENQPFIQDACDLVEYCNGAATSKWGAVRAANGHPTLQRQILGNGQRSLGRA